jgi:hypothetical protein
MRRKLRVLRARFAEGVSVGREDGAAAALRFGANVAGSAIREILRPAARRSNAFDEQFGTDTATNVKLHGLDIQSANYRFGIYYEPTEPSVLDAVLSALAIRHEEYSLLDYGCGKGLVVLKAAAYPFQRVVGVEFARELHEIALRNLARHPEALRRAPVELVHGDVLEYEPPEGNLVIYVYEPFEAPVTEQLLARIESLLPGRDLWVAYVWTKERGISSKPLWDRAPFLQPVVEADGWTLYRGAAR